MRITLTSIFVDDQEQALRFYTDVLGFRKKQDIDLGGPRWITVVSPDQPESPELVLEPASHPAVGPFRSALVADGIPFNSFSVEDCQAEYERLVAAGVVFTQPPVAMGPVTMAVFDDTCGNLMAFTSQNR